MTVEELTKLEHEFMDKATPKQWSEYIRNKQILEAREIDRQMEANKKVAEMYQEQLDNLKLKHE